MHGGGGKKAEFDLRVRRLKAFARPAAGADGDERLIDRPGRALLIDIRVNKCGDPFLLIRLSARDYASGMKATHNEQDADQIAQRNSAHEKQRQQDRPPNNALPQIRLHQNQKTRRADNRTAKQQPKHGMHLAELAQEQSEHHDTGDNRQLRGLKINRSQMKPAARAINFRAHEFGQNQKAQASQIHRRRPSESSDNQSGS